MLSDPVDLLWIQAVAREMNLSETAFIVPEHDGFDLRWFTPRVEVELLRDATLASAHVLWQQRYWAPESVPVSSRRAARSRQN